jgi:D-alanyl-D-alanine carboxypeptidase (penicillin-binding protein 5/6)
MTTRWFDPIAAGLVAVALLGLGGSSTEVSAKMKGAILARAPEPKVNALVAPPPAVVGGIDTQAKHALILEVETGAVLLDKFAEERIPPASMSKVMTAYLVFDYLKQGRAKLEDELPVS